MKKSGNISNLHPHVKNTVGDLSVYELICFLDCEICKLQSKEYKDSRRKRVIRDTDGLSFREMTKEEFKQFKKINNEKCKELDQLFSDILTFIEGKRIMDDIARKMNNYRKSQQDHE